MAKRYQSPIIYRLREIPVKQIKTWKDAQARKLDREGIAELAKSIKNEGLQNPPMVQKESKNSYLLLSGQRRLVALKRLGAKKIPVLLLTQSTRYDLEDAKAASVVENLHRNKLNIKDMTAACVFLTESVGGVDTVVVPTTSTLTKTTTDVDPEVFDRDRICRVQPPVVTEVEGVDPPSIIKFTLPTADAQPIGITDVVETLVGDVFTTGIFGDEFGSITFTPGIGLGGPGHQIFLFESSIIIPPGEP